MATQATLRTSTWDAIYTYLQTTNPISTNNIYSSYNSTLVKDVGYPLVIIMPPSTSYMKASQDGILVESDVVVNIEIYTTSAQTAKSLGDEVTTKILAGRQTFSGEGLKNMDIEQVDYDHWEDGNKKIHRQTFAVTYRFVQHG
jgi:hypothetical protein